jgi:hypothetical protein
MGGQSPSGASIRSEYLPSSVFAIWPSCSDCTLRMVMVAERERSTLFICSYCGKRVEVPA